MKVPKEIIIGVYKITNTITDKYYIGYAKNIYKRFDEHRNTLKNGSHQNIILQRSYNKYTLEAFTFEILHTFDNIEYAKNKELEYLGNLEIRHLLYNIHYNNSGGDILSNHPDKEEIRKIILDTQKITLSKMSKDEKQKWAKNGDKNGMFGKTHTEESRKIMSEKNKGISKNLGFKHSDEMKEKLSKIHKTKIHKTKIQEKNSFYGKTHTEEVKKKISESNKNRKYNVETNKKITIDNINYNSLSEAFEKLKIPVPTISWRIKSKTSKFDNYKYTDEENIKLPLSTKISIDNIEYNSVEEASKKLNFTNNYITRRLNSDDEEDSEWKILDKPRDKRIQVGKKVMINDTIYNSVKEASEKLNIVESLLIKRLKSKTPIPVTPKKSVSIDNIIYESVTEASKQLNKNINVLISHLKSDDEKWNTFYYLPIEYIDVTKYKYI